MSRCFLVFFTLASATACGGERGSAESVEAPHPASVPPASLHTSAPPPPATTKAPPTVASGCSEFVDTSIADGTQFPYVVDYERTADTIAAGDRIVVIEVRGTRPHFEKGGTYLVKGEYMLDSATEATLLLSVTATEGKGCTTGTRGARAESSEVRGRSSSRRRFPTRANRT
jgi:hypothetical protein